MRRSNRLALWSLLGMTALSLAAWQAPTTKKPNPVALVIHGGVGVMTNEEMARARLEDGTPLTRSHFETALAESLDAGYRAWKTSSVDAVEAAIRVLEDSELFNAGRGAALNQDGIAELDAAIMQGEMSPSKKAPGKRDGRKRAGAVAAVQHVKNPISAARAVMEMPNARHVLLSGTSAEAFVLSAENQKKYALERVSNTYFWTSRRLRQTRSAAARKGADAREPRDERFGTVGAVAVKDGAITAGTSTGGLTNKMPGRIGDTPVLGAGTYADDRACGVSCTGTGELFLRHVVAYDVVARMLYNKQSVEEAAKAAIDELPDEAGGVGALIALDAKGNQAFCLSARSNGMYRGYVTTSGEIYVAIFRDETPVRLVRDEKTRGWIRAAK